MIYSRTIIAALVYVPMALVVIESDFIRSLLPALSWIGMTVGLALVSWYIAKPLTRAALFPFRISSTRHRAILITGCDSGFGHLTALTLNRSGFFVFAACFNVNSDGAKRLMRDACHPTRLRLIQMDVTSVDEVKQAYDVVNNLLKKSSCQLFGLVNNAGIMRISAIEFSDPQSVADYEEQLSVNTLGVIRVTRTFLPLIRRSKGRIVNISSMMSRVVTPGTSAYSVSKAACTKFTECLQIEMSPFGVSVICIEPWISKTNMITGKDLLESLSKSWDQTPSSVRSEYTSGYFHQLLRFITIMTGLPLSVQPNQVVDAVVEALTSLEPCPFSTVCNTIVNVPLWVINDIICWEYVVLVRKYLFWAIFRLLSIEQLFIRTPNGS